MRSKSLEGSVTSENSYISSDDISTRCKVCHKEFITPGNLKAHVDYYLQNKIQCCSCLMDFQTFSALKRHVRWHAMTVGTVAHMCGRRGCHQQGAQE